MFTIAVWIGYIVQAENNEDSKYIGVQLSLIDHTGKMILRTIKTEDDIFNGNIMISVDSNSETHYSAILMKNYQQVAFSINNLEKRTVQDIEIPATDGIVKKKFEISFGLSEDGFNDCLLLLLEKNGKDNVFSMRFTIQKGKREKYKSDIKSNGRFFEIDKITLEQITDKDLCVVDSNLCETQNIYLDNKSPYLKIILNYENRLMQTSFAEQYLDAKKKEEEVRIGFFVISKNKLVPISQRNINIKTGYYVDNVQIMLNTKFITSEIKSFRVFAIMYPFKTQNNMLGTYEMVNWDSIFYSNYILVNETSIEQK